MRENKTKYNNYYYYYYYYYYYCILSDMFILQQLFLILKHDAISKF